MARLQPKGSRGGAPARPPAAAGAPKLLAHLWALVDAAEDLHISIKRGGVTLTLDVDVRTFAFGSDSFVASDLQERILGALDGKGLRTDAIAAKCDCDRRQLYNLGGIKELQEQGLVAWHKRLGFYRPDRPPPGAQPIGPTEALPS